MSPSQFLDEYISIHEDFSDVAGMVASNFVVLDTLILAVILFI